MGKGGILFCKEGRTGAYAATMASSAAAASSVPMVFPVFPIELAESSVCSPEAPILCIMHILLGGVLGFIPGLELRESIVRIRRVRLETPETPWALMKLRRRKMLWLLRMLLS